MSAPNFNEYAKYYDALYQGKDYVNECQFIMDVIRSYGSLPVGRILDLGCGTGGHALELARNGYLVHGIDLSSKMLEQARIKSERMKLIDKVNWIQGDIAELNLNDQFDMVISMFSVVCYLTSNARFSKFLSVVRNHLKTGGLFVIDFWYGPAVLFDPPKTNQKSIQSDDGTVIERVATVEQRVDENVFQISYHITSRKDGVMLEDVREEHRIRYFFLPELEYMAKIAGLEIVHSCNCCKIKDPTSAQNWTISVIFKAL